ncbi:trypsin-like peptidase domain-containing protein [Mucilaginibacter roseus]|uniref:Trypsin-like peptidase domain-containing protein n=1 Tax=Mucilaginibacter roseus TaxID=1528868 RepID=A0ABS8U4U7_9SPHI|nr:trypsin-like peptidase domain-containing protein [Mucilaginibacter roseus]MCD8742129.1 trypsin-like peptidase domain-containing protein [Mucilaginibacter roseus]
MKKFIVTCLSITLFLGVVKAQKVKLPQLQATLQKGIKSAYFPSVRMWGYDTTARQQMSAQFSGVVVTADGYILTAAHVTIPGKTYKVMFADGKEAIAVALGKIELAADRTIPDVALMKIVTRGSWPFAPMANSSTIKINEPCLSIAYPESLNQSKPTIRYGRIRAIKNDRGFIESTCKMEPGDSGGPLFDYMGRVIGIHSAINTDEDTNYEIPVDLYHKYWNALQKQQVYTEFPTDTQAIAHDNIKNLLTEPGMANIQPTSAVLIKKYKLDRLVVNITSTADSANTPVLGTIVKANGSTTYIVSKSSIVGNDPKIITSGNKTSDARVIARDRQTDLVLLKTSTNFKDAITIAQNDQSGANLGSLLINPVSDKEGLISITSGLDVSLTRFWSLGYLGAAVGYSAVPPTFTFVQPNSPAAKAGLLVDDEVLSVNNVAMKKIEDFGEVTQQYWPGDTVNFKILRSGKQESKTVTLGNKRQTAGKHPAELFKGGKSVRRDGFEKVITHDAALLPTQCGGPVFNIDGKFVGINIARFSRTTSLVLPAQVIYNFILNNLKNQ